MEFPEAKRDVPPLLTHTVPGEFPRLPVEAASAEGAVKGLIPGTWKFIHKSTLVVGYHSLQTMIDTADRLPEDQTGQLEPFAVMRVEFISSEGETIEGYVVDCRYGDLKLSARDHYGNEDEIKAYQKFEPVAPLAIAYTNRSTNKTELIGDPRAESTLRHLMNEVDAWAYIMGVVEEEDRLKAEKDAQRPKEDERNVQHLTSAARSLYRFTTCVLPLPESIKSKLR